MIRESHIWSFDFVSNHFRWTDCYSCCKAFELANVDKKNWTQEETEDFQVNVNVTFRKEDFKCFLEDNIFEQLQISVTFKETTNQTVFAEECQIDESRPSDTPNDFDTFLKRKKRST